MSVPAFLEYSYNSACPECGLAGWEHEATCSQAEPPRAPAAIGYHCCYCGGTFDATEADIAEARASVAEIAEDECDPALAGMDDAEAFRQFGRDVCPACIPKFKAEQESRRVSSAQWAAAVAANEQRIASYGGEYGVPANE